MRNSPFPYFVNHYNLNMAQKKPHITIRYSKKLFSYVHLFYTLGAIKSFMVTIHRGVKQISFSVNHFSGAPCFKSIRQISRPSKQYNISYRILKLLSKSLNQAVILLSTSYGVITNIQALKRRVGGIILAILI